MPRQESHLERKLRQLGLSPTKGAAKKSTFRLYFPRPPHGHVEYRAARLQDGYNFVGLLLGHGGATLQKIQRQTGTKIEIHDDSGNLNGSHPNVNDPSLHAVIIGDNKENLVSAVSLISEALQPNNTKFERIKVEVDGSGILKPVLSQSMSAHRRSARSEVPLLSEHSSSESWTPTSLSPTSSLDISRRDANAWSDRRQAPMNNLQFQKFAAGKGWNNSTGTGGAQMNNAGLKSSMPAKQPSTWSDSSSNSSTISTDHHPLSNMAGWPAFGPIIEFDGYQDASLQAFVGMSFDDEAISENKDFDISSSCGLYNPLNGFDLSGIEAAQPPGADWSWMPTMNNLGAPPTLPAAHLTEIHRRKPFIPASTPAQTASEASIDHLMQLLTVNGE